MSRELERLSRLQAQLAPKALDAFIILEPSNLRYLCGFTGGAGVLTVTPDARTLYIDVRYAEQAAAEVTAAHIVEAPTTVLVHAAKSLRHPRRAGFEANNLAFGAYEDLQKALPDTEMVGLRRVVETLRAVKDADELECIRQAAAVADRVWDEFCLWCKPGQSENEVAAWLEYHLRLAGGERLPSGSLGVASGARTALPYPVPSDRTLAANEPLTLALGTVVGGYCSDLTRTVYLGKLSPEYQSVYRIVHDAQERALDGIRAGMTTRAADALARSVIESAGYGSRFGHGLGHSLGLDAHEDPNLHPQDTDTLLADMVLTVEPGIYLRGSFGVRIGDLIRVTEDGCELLSHSTRALHEF